MLLTIILYRSGRIRANARCERRVTMRTGRRQAGRDPWSLDVVWPASPYPGASRGSAGRGQRQKLRRQPFLFPDVEHWVEAEEFAVKVAGSMAEIRCSFETRGEVPARYRQPCLAQACRNSLYVHLWSKMRPGSHRIPSCPHPPGAAEGRGGLRVVLLEIIKEWKGLAYAGARLATQQQI